MTEAEWLADNKLYGKIDSLTEVVENDRRLRLFACACCRHAWELMSWDSVRRIVELSEAYSDDDAIAAELQAAYYHPDFANFDAQYRRGEGEIGLQLTRREIDAIDAARYMARLDDYYFDPSVIAQNTSKLASGDFIPNADTDGPGLGVLPDDAELADKEKIYGTSSATRSAQSPSTPHGARPPSFLWLKACTKAVTSPRCRSSPTPFRMPGARTRTS